MASTPNPYRAPAPAPPADRPPAASAPYVVLAALCSIAAIAYGQRNAIGVCKAEIQRDLGLDHEQFGGVLSAFFLGYACLQIPAGWVSDRFGSRGPMAFFMAISSLAAAGLALMHDRYSMMALWFAAGVGQAGLFPCAARVIVRWLPATLRAVASGLLGGSMSVGAAVSAMVCGLLLSWDLDWRWITLLFAAPGLMMAALYYYWYRDLPADRVRANDMRADALDAGDNLTHAAERRRPTPWGAIFGSVNLWFICGQQFFRAAGYIFFLTWFSTYLSETRNLSIGTTGFLSSLPLVGVVAGSFLAGATSDFLLAVTGSRRISRQGLAIVSMLTCAALVVPVFWIESAVGVTLLISAGSFCSAFGGPVAYTVTMDIGGRHVATVFSVMNMCGNLGAAAFPYVVGMFAERGAWDEVLILFAGLYVATAACWAFVNPDQPIVDP